MAVGAGTADRNSRQRPGVSPPLQVCGHSVRRSCKALDIDDLRFHDLRHEGTSRLFEAGFPIEKVAMVTGHKDWRMLRRYTNLKPEDLHKLQKASQPSMEEFIETLAASVAL